MLKATSKVLLLLLAAVLVGTVLYPAVTTAQSARAQETQGQAADRRQNNVQPQRSERGDSASQRRNENAQKNRSLVSRGQGRGRLEASQLRICEQREKAILSIMARISDRGAKQLDVFTKIADRAQAFYVEQGNPLSNYDALVEDADAKKAAAQNAVDLVLSEDDDFRCDGSDPRAVADRFKASKQAMNEALKSYKTAVKNLIVGVRSAHETAPESGEEGSE